MLAKGHLKVNCLNSTTVSVRSCFGTVNPYIRPYPFPSLSLGDVVAVKICSPSGHHSKYVESLACKINIAMEVTMGYMFITRSSESRANKDKHNLSISD